MEELEVNYAAAAAAAASEAAAERAAAAVEAAGTAGRGGRRRSLNGTSSRRRNRLSLGSQSPTASTSPRRSLTASSTTAVLHRGVKSRLLRSMAYKPLQLKATTATNPQGTATSPTASRLARRTPRASRLRHAARDASTVGENVTAVDPAPLSGSVRKRSDDCGRSSITSQPTPLGDRPPNNGEPVPRAPVDRTARTHTLMLMCLQGRSRRQASASSAGYTGNLKWGSRRRCACRPRQPPPSHRRSGRGRSTSRAVLQHHQRHLRHRLRPRRQQRLHGCKVPSAFLSLLLAASRHAAGHQWLPPPARPSGPRQSTTVFAALCVSTFSRGAAPHKPYVTAGPSHVVACTSRSRCCLRSPPKPPLTV